MTTKKFCKSYICYGLGGKIMKPTLVETEDVSQNVNCATEDGGDT